MIRFCNHKLDDGELPEKFEEYDMSIGLHTCGGLSRIQLKHSIRAGLPKILNFGCCYYMMEAEDC